MSDFPDSFLRAFPDHRMDDVNWPRDWTDWTAFKHADDSWCFFRSFFLFFLKSRSFLLYWRLPTSRRGGLSLSEPDWASLRAFDLDFNDTFRLEPWTGITSCSIFYRFSFILISGSSLLGRSSFQPQSHRYQRSITPISREPAQYQVSSRLLDAA